MKIWILLVPALLPAILAGCASGLGGGDYERKEARRVYEVKMGVVESVRSVKLEGTASGVGATAGGVVGGVAGAAAEEAATRKPGIEITVRLDSGRTIAVVQEDTGEKFAPGERVRMLESGGQARITH